MSGRRDNPVGRAEWEQWEREHGCRTVARCSGCGRGYMWVKVDGRACHACGSPVRLLPGFVAGKFAEDTSA